MEECSFHITSGEPCPFGNIAWVGPLVIQLMMAVHHLY